MPPPLPVTSAPLPPPIDVRWGEWEAWAPCVPCRPTYTQTRERRCLLNNGSGVLLDPGNIGPCLRLRQGADIETRPCVCSEEGAGQEERETGQKTGRETEQEMGQKTGQEKEQETGQETGRETGRETEQETEQEVPRPDTPPPPPSSSLPNEPRPRPSRKSDAEGAQGQGERVSGFPIRSG